MTGPGFDYQRNLDALRRHLPGLAQALEQMAAPRTAIVRQGDMASNIDLGSRLLYDQPADAYVRGQLDSYRQSSRRIVVAHAAGVNHASRIAMRLFEDLTETITRRDMTLESAPQGTVGVLLVFGIGLGLHLRPLIETYDTQSIIIVEPYLEFLHHSLTVCDWAGLFALAEEKGKEIIILCQDHPGDAFTLIDRYLVRDGAYFLDGSYLFTHYSSWYFTEVERRLARNASHYFVVPGFFEDEVTMTTRATGNFYRTPFHLLEPARRPRRTEPAFIVGSGPSLDETIEVVRKWQGHAVIFSCGTALQALLANGVRPDFHCELENGFITTKVLSHTREKYPLDGIHLIASATVHHLVPPMFDSATLFFRDSVSSTMTYGRGHGVLGGTAPTVTNTAFSAATALGFHDIFLFGVDCGGRTADKFHSDKTIYRTMAETGERPWTMQVAGNFGGTVGTDWVFDLTRRMLELAQKSRRANVYNCSNGALIRGAVPRLAATLRFTHAALDKPATIAAVLATMPAYAPGQFLDDCPVEDFIAASEAFVPVTEAALAGAMAEDVDFPRLHRRLMALIATGEREHRGIVHLVSGSAQAMLKIGQFFVNRVQGEADKQMLFERFTARFHALLLEMVRECPGVFSKARDTHRDRKDIEGDDLAPPQVR